MLRTALLNLLLLAAYATLAQNGVTGIVLDAETRQPLPFATIHIPGTKQGSITEMDGRFSINVPGNEIELSYIGFEKTIFLLPHTSDSFFLKPLTNTMGEVVIKPPYDKVKRLVDLAIENKDSHDPEKYDWYRCHIYHKLTIDFLPDPKYTGKDSSIYKMKTFLDKSHLLFSENYTERTYRSPKQLQEVVLASKWSGMKKTHFTTLVTDFLPFDVYKDFIKLQGKDYLHPVSKGWQQRYDFDIVDELLDGSDTIFILKYGPKKNASFNSLKGTVYINSNGYAISHFITNTNDTVSNRYIKMEQVYRHVNGKWFPRELNYDFVFKKYPNEHIGLRLTGHSLIDSVSYDELSTFKFDKAHPVKLHDSADLRTEAQWATYRFDPLSQKEETTYKVIDSVLEKENINLDGFLSVFGKTLALGLVPVGPVDIDIKRLLAFNNYEGTRLGIGLYTNERISRYFSVGGWFGYGFKDKVLKYGGNLQIMPMGNREHVLDLFYQKTYQNSGVVNFHRELDRSTVRNWVLAQVDQVEEYGATAQTRLGYWELTGQAKQQELIPQYSYTFSEPGNNMRFDVREASIGLRFAYAEKRTPLSGYYLPQFNPGYPVLYMRVSGGTIGSGLYETEYYRALLGLTYNTHINRWGSDKFRVQGGMIKTLDDKALPRSFLLAGGGFRTTDDFQWQAWGGFVTMFPYQFFSDKYASLMYVHDFDRRLYKTKFSNPFVSVAHNVLWGQLNTVNETANAGIQAPDEFYHESGLILNHLYKFNYFNFAYLAFNVGAYYHWAPTFDWKKNGRIVFGIAFDL